MTSGKDVGLIAVGGFLTKVVLSTKGNRGSSKVTSRSTKGVSVHIHRSRPHNQNTLFILSYRTQCNRCADN